VWRTGDRLQDHRHHPPDRLSDHGPGVADRGVEHLRRGRHPPHLPRGVRCYEGRIDKAAWGPIQRTQRCCLECHRPHDEVRQGLYHRLPSDRDLGGTDVRWPGRRLLCPHSRNQEGTPWPGPSLPRGASLLPGVRLHHDHLRGLHALRGEDGAVLRRQHHLHCYWNVVLGGGVLLLPDDG